MTRKLISIALFFLAVTTLGAIYVHSEKDRADSQSAHWGNRKTWALSKRPKRLPYAPQHAPLLQLKRNPSRDVPKMLVLPGRFTVVLSAEAL